MNILHITTAFQRNRQDIITPWLVNLLRAQSESNDVFVLTSGYGRVKNKQILGKIKIFRFNYAPKNLMKMTHDLTIQDYISRNPLSILLMPLFFFSGILKCLEIVRQEKINIIIVHWPFPLFFIAFPAKILNGKKIISVFYGADIKLFKNKFKKLHFILESICNHSDSIVAISNSTAKELTDLSRVKNISVIPYGVTMKDSKRNSKENLIITVGRQVERKGTEYLIKAMKYIDSAYKLAIIGNGPLIGNLRDLTVKENLSDRVSFEGWVSDDKLEEFYERAKIFVLPAIYDSRGETEGLGMVLVEAMMHKAVCVASGIGGIPDIIKDKNTGFISKEKNYEDISEKINYIIRNKETSDLIAKNALEFCSKEFSLTSVEKKYEHLIKQVSFNNGKA